MGISGKKHCRGQAVTEMMACLIGICFVILGMLFVSVVGSKGVRNILEARKDAESNIVHGSGSASGQSIGVWFNIEAGQGDGLYFTADDSSTRGNAGNPAFFRKELISTNGDFDIPALAGKRKTENYIPFSLENNPLFLRAADLKEGSSTLTDPLGDKNLFDLKRALGKFGLGTEITIQDKLYLPDISETK